MPESDGRSASRRALASRPCLPCAWATVTALAVPLGDQVVDLLAGVSHDIPLQHFERGVLHHLELDIFEHIRFDLAQEADDIVASKGPKFSRLQSRDELPQAHEFFHTPMFV